MRTTRERIHNMQLQQRGSPSVLRIHVYMYTFIPFFFSLSLTPGSAVAVAAVVMAVSGGI